jgi:hypothetical protein
MAQSPDPRGEAGAAVQRAGRSAKAETPARTAHPRGVRTSSTAFHLGFKIHRGQKMNRFKINRGFKNYFETTLFGI